MTTKRGKSLHKEDLSNSKINANPLTSQENNNDMTSPVKIAIYARVSKDELDPTKHQYQDPENQLQPLRSFAQAMNYVVVGEYVDREKGNNPNRPQFRKMLQEGMMRHFDGILFWNLDRFSREGITSTLSYIQQLKGRGVWLRSYTESWMDTTPGGVGELLIAIMSWVAAEERRKISERTKAGIRRRRAIGQWKGGRPKKKGEG